jgi:hypothetical protein
VQQVPEEESDYTKDHDEDEDSRHPKDQIDIDHGKIDRHFLPFDYAV